MHGLSMHQACMEGAHTGRAWGGACTGCAWGVQEPGVHGGFMQQEITQ